MVKYVNGQILLVGVEYFEQVLNVKDVREANINVRCDWWMPVMGEFNE